MGHRGGRGAVHRTAPPGGIGRDNPERCREARGPAVDTAALGQDTAASMERFRIDVADDVLADLHARLDRTRWPNQIDGAGWDYGAELSYVQELCGYWREGFDWRAEEARLNAWDQFATTVDGQRIHFVHARSTEPDAMPLMIAHGWPGSIVEFTKVIEPLRDPASHGGDRADAFHVVCPSLPGYTFSGPTHERGWSPRRVATAYGELMRTLGYPRYGMQGGDWGAIVAIHMGDLRPPGLCGVHLNLMPVRPPKGFDMSTLTESEQSNLAAATDFYKDGNGYLEIQRTRPQTIGYALDDSPAGLAAWIAEKFIAWTDCADADGKRDIARFESLVSRDDLLANIMIYWATRTATSSARLYFEGFNRSGSLPKERIELPVGCALFPAELMRPPRAWCEAAYNLEHWTEMPRGGHFAALEQPELFVEDVRKFFRLQR